MSHCLSFPGNKSSDPEKKRFKGSCSAGGYVEPLPVTVYLTVPYNCCLLFILSTRATCQIPVISLLECWSNFLLVMCSLFQVLPLQCFFSFTCCHWSCWTLVWWYPSTDSEPIRLTNLLEHQIQNLQHGIQIAPDVISASFSVLTLSSSSCESHSSDKLNTLHSLKHFGFRFLILEVNYTDYLGIPPSLPQIIYIFISIERTGNAILSIFTK